MNNFKVIFLFILFINIAHADSPGFKEVTDSRKFTFPEDHGSHPSYKTEWWYYTGHLKTAEDRTFGFQLTFFRVGLNPPAENFSAWHVQSIYLAHFAISDDQNKTFYHFEKNSRGAFKDAGASKDRLNVWNGSWETSMDNSLIKINASENNHSVNLNLKPVKPLVLQGDEGFSKKGDKEGQASYYYSFTRLEGDGNIVLNNKSYNIQASVWMDREFTSSQLARAKKGWDWFAIQLD